jgi:hypothetical protein
VRMVEYPLKWPKYVCAFQFRSNKASPIGIGKHVDLACSRTSQLEVDEICVVKSHNQQNHCCIHQKQ